MTKQNINPDDLVFHSFLERTFAWLFATVLAMENDLSMEEVWGMMHFVDGRYSNDRRAEDHKKAAEFFLMTLSATNLDMSEMLWSMMRTIREEYKHASEYQLHHSRYHT